eukprot:756517-Hanusia_phi.AAC.2
MSNAPSCAADSGKHMSSGDASYDYTLQAPVSKFVVNGADLMLPGVAGGVLSTSTAKLQKTCQTSTRYGSESEGEGENARHVGGSGCLEDEEETIAMVVTKMIMMMRRLDVDLLRWQPDAICDRGHADEQEGGDADMCAQQFDKEPGSDHFRHEGQ